MVCLISATNKDWLVGFTKTDEKFGLLFTVAATKRNRTPLGAAMLSTGLGQNTINSLWIRNPPNFILLDCRGKLRCLIMNSDSMFPMVLSYADPMLDAAFIGSAGEVTSSIINITHSCLYNMVESQPASSFK